MCGPMLAIIGAVASFAGSMMQANAQASAAEAQANAYRAEAELQRRQALAEQMAGQREAAQKENQIAQIESQQRVSYASAGVRIDSGSVVDVAQDTVREGMLDVGAIQWGADVKSSNYNYAAQITDMKAKSQDNAASTYRSMGPIMALSSAVGSLSSMSKSSGGTSLSGSFFGA
jgi:multidrug efflux pump subunit AcrA (membrane-fusion protein)